MLSRLFGRWLGAICLCFALALLLSPSVAMAQASASTVDLRPLVTSDEVWQAIGGVASILLAYALRSLPALIKLHVDDRVRAYLDAILQKGIALAQVKAGSLPLKIDVGSPFVADAANYAIAHAPAALKWFGVDAQGDAIKNMVAARTQILVNQMVAPVITANPADLPARTEG